MFNEEQSFQILDFVFVFTNHITKLTCSSGLLLILLVNNNWHLVNYHLFSRKINIISFRKIKHFWKHLLRFYRKSLSHRRRELRHICWQRSIDYSLVLLVFLTLRQENTNRSHHIRCFWLNLVLLAYIYSYWHISMLTLLLSLMMLANNFYNCLFLHVLYNEMKMHSIHSLCKINMF